MAGPPGPGQRVGISLHRRGSGPPLLLVHGLGHRWQAWEPVLDRLASAHDVIAVDLPGFGGSPLPADGVLDMAVTVRRFPAWLDQIGVERPHVAGNSLGGALALEMAAAGLAASATAFSPAGFSTVAEWRRATARLSWLRAQAFLPVPALRVLLRSRTVRAASLGLIMAHPDRLSPERAAADALALRRGRGFRPMALAGRGYRFSGQELRTRPDVPVTVAWGAADRILPPRQALRAQAELPHARHLLLPGCGHVPMTDDPGLVADTILATTGGQPPAGGQPLT